MSGTAIGKGNKKTPKYKSTGPDRPGRINLVTTMICHGRNRQRYQGDENGTKEHAEDHRTGGPSHAP